MVERKIFAGPRIRHIRRTLGLTQTTMAEALAISPSYLNLIERNQRPLTVQLLLKLSSVYRIDPDELQEESLGNVGRLREIFADPLLAGEISGDQELLEMTEAVPNAARAMVKLYSAYREQAARLKDLTELLVREGRAPLLSGARLPMDEVREKFEGRPNFFSRLEDAAESFIEKLSPGDELATALKAWLRSEHGIAMRILPVHAMPTLRRRFDRHSMRLFLSERLSAADQLHEMAVEIALLAFRDEIAAELEALVLTTPEAKRIARFELARYAAHALVMPYGVFLAAAQRTHYDIDVLRSRFSSSFERVASRLVALQRPGSAGIPFFVMEIDAAGNRLRKAGAEGFPQIRFGGGCPKLNIHTAFAEPGQVLVDAVEMPDGDSFIILSRTIEGPMAGFGERVRRKALLLGCDIGFRDDIVYGAAVAGRLPVGIGASCRLCERQGCLARAEPPVTRPLGLGEAPAGLSEFDFQ
ncbi:MULTISPECIES: short-chain fatty acyl-CoA regulator family protein [unclassified Sinorhizobium]|uniref:helix-turn-helix domain-containing protein n=1 Tax=unclassified Sinorhizobium TaxID=2613772 RepID=UPI00352560EB